MAWGLMVPAAGCSGSASDVKSSVPTQLTRMESAAKYCQLRGEELPTEPPAQRDSCCWEDQTSVGSYAPLMVAELVTATEVLRCLAST